MQFFLFLLELNGYVHTAQSDNIIPIVRTQFSMFNGSVGPKEQRPIHTSCHCFLIPCLEENEGEKKQSRSREDQCNEGLLQAVFKGIV